MKLILTALSALALTVASAWADPVEDRQAVMKSFGGALGKLAPVARGQQPFDADAVLAALNDLNAAAQKLDVAAMFPEGSIEGDSEALPAIWENMDDFTARVEKLKSDVAGIVAAPPADVEGVQGALGVIGPNCGGCHENYRLKKG